MAKIITMPRLSDTMTEGTVAAWLKKVGDKVSEGDILAEIETDKATMEFESFNEGVLLHIGIPAGETAPIDSLLAVIGKEGEDISAILAGNSEPKNSSTPEEATNPKETTTAPVGLPAGVVVVTMPRLSDTMTEGTVATWLKKVGDKVNEGDILAEIETDKATMEFESFNEGTLLYIGIQEGSSAPIDSLLAIIGPAGTNTADIIKGFSVGATVATPSMETVTAPQHNHTSNTEVMSGDRILASPLAKKIAAEKGISLNQVKGTGENGRITKEDVENFIPEIKSIQASVVANIENPSVKVVNQPAFVPTGEIHKEEIKNSQMRKIIAKRLAESLFTAPHYNLTIEVVMDEAIHSRAKINSLPDIKISFNDMIIKACAMALRKHPNVNSQWNNDTTIINHHINIGVAVAVEDGLVVPVIKFTDNLSLSQISNSIRDLAGRAKTKKLVPSEMEGSTFSISNLGMFGITEFNSIINQPNSSILSVGAIVEKPIVKDGQIVVGNTMILTLACDHRTIDGATGAQFLQTLKQYVENPVTMLA